MGSLCSYGCIWILLLWVSMGLYFVPPKQMLVVRWCLFCLFQQLQIFGNYQYLIQDMVITLLVCLTSKQCGEVPVFV